MRFNLRSLGGKLILSAVVTLLLCLLFFSVLAWSLLSYLSEHEAKSDGLAHLTRIEQTYQARNALLIKNLTTAASNIPLPDSISKHYILSSRNHVFEMLTPLLVRYHLEKLAMVSANRFLLAQTGD